MEATGLVVSAWEAGGKGHAKRLYEITRDGKACLVRWTSTLEAYQASIGKLLKEAKAATARRPKRRKIGAKQVGPPRTQFPVPHRFGDCSPPAHRLRSLTTGRSAIILVLVLYQR